MGPGSPADASAAPLAVPPLAVRSLRDVLLVPLSVDRSAGLPFRVGGFDSHGTVIAEMRLQRGTARAGDPLLPDPAQEPIATLDGEFAYGGILIQHFGHFLLESLARLHALRQMPALPVLWHRWGKPAAWQDQILGLVGIAPSQCLVVERPSRVRLLHVARSGFVIRQRFDPALAEMLRVRNASPTGSGTKLWLSRSGLRQSRKKITGEAEVESILEANGWCIYRPEQHGVAEQLDALAAAHVVAGVEGSAFHSLLLLRDFRGRVVMLPRQPRTGQINFNHWLIFGAQGLKPTLLPGLLDAAPPTPNGPWLTFPDPAAAANAIMRA